MIAFKSMAEQWLQDKLRAGFEPEALPGGVVTVPGLPEGGNQQTEKRLVGLFGRLPAIGTYMASGSYELPRQDCQVERVDCWLLCVAANSRGPGAALRGDAQQLGAWDLCDQVRELLSNQHEQNLTFEPRSWRLLWCDTGVAVVALEVTITIARALAGPDLDF